MDPCQFVRLIVESLTLKLPAVSIPAGPGVHPSATPCFASLTLLDSTSSSSSSSTTHTSPLPLSSAPSGELFTTTTTSPPVIFSLDADALHRLYSKPATLLIAVHAGARAGRSCGMSGGRVLGKVRLVVELGAEVMTRAAVLQSGWVGVGRGGGGGGGGGGARLHVVVRTEPDPRFVFQFGGEPECSPVVYQVQGNGGGGRRSGCLRQPVFSCRFSADRRQSSRSRSLPPSSSHSIRAWLGAFGSERVLHQRREQRKGWTVTIHDLSGSPVAAASMVTPFVPSPGSDRVSRSNPGAWLILQPVGFTPTTNWKPWGRLEAWRERGPVDALGYRFELVVTDVAAGPNSGILIAESSIGVRKGGRFCIDGGGDAASRPSWSPAGGFVMESTVEGEGKVSRPAVQVGVQHVTCMTDAALFVALAAAVDLSMDACQLFSQKLRKELCQDRDE